MRHPNPLPASGGEGGVAAGSEPRHILPSKHIRNRSTRTRMHEMIFRSTKPLLILLAVLLGATPCLSASDGFSTEQASPLKLANPRHGRVAHFVGKVRLSGKFFVGWEFSGRKPTYPRAVFFPDPDSTKLLPHAAESRPVQELLFPDAAQAAAI